MATFFRRIINQHLRLITYSVFKIPPKFFLKEIELLRVMYGVSFFSLIKCPESLFFFQSQDKKMAFDETRQYVVQSLASVAYQVNTLAYALLHALDLQTDKINNMISEVRFFFNLKYSKTNVFIAISIPFLIKKKSMFCN